MYKIIATTKTSFIKVLYNFVYTLDLVKFLLMSECLASCPVDVSPIFFGFFIQIKRVVS